MNANDLRSMSAEQLKKEHLELLREQFNLRMQKGSGGLTRTHNINITRKNIARVLTILAEKQEKNDD